MKNSLFKNSELGLIPLDWKEYSVEKLIELGYIYKPLDGNHGSIHPKGKDFIDSGIPFIMASDINNGKVNLKDCSFISEEQANSLQKGFSIEGDVLLTHKATLGRTAIVPKISTNFIMLTPQVTYYRIKNKEYLNNKYLKYYFDSPSFQGILENHGSSGSTRSYIGITAQRELPIILPSLPEQKAIASVLSSLDDKIDLLHQQNQTLEALAETLFRQWFIEEAKEEWERKKIGDVLLTVLGGTPSTTKEEFWNGNIPWINSGEVNKFRILEGTKFITELGLKKSNTKLLPIGTTVIAITGATLGQISLLEIDTCANQSVVGIVPNEKLSKSFVFLWVKNKINEIILNETGGAQPHINKNDINETEIIIPDSESIDYVKNNIDPLFDKISKNCFQIQTLAKLRDTLLPKLMSGEVRVKN